MKKAVALLLLAAFLLGAPGCASKSVQPETQPPTLPAEPAVTVPVPTPADVAHIPFAEPVLDLSDGEKEMLLRIGMAERGGSGCPECIALVMCTVLNRVESGRFGGSISKVLFAQDQFTPVSTGYYYRVKPNELCYDALEMIVYGWDESQGALYYEWCEGESWHSRNLNLLFQHCDTRFYD